MGDVRPQGRAEIKQIFDISKTGKICGCVVTSGAIRINASARVTRDDELIYPQWISASWRHGWEKTNSQPLVPTVQP